MIHTIETVGLVKRHGALEVLRGISLSVAKGEVAAIIGPSGGGKSTFLRCLNGLERFQGGTVRIGDESLSATDPTRSATARSPWFGGGSGWCSRGFTSSRTWTCSET